MYDGPLHQRPKLKRARVEISFGTTDGYSGSSTTTKGSDPAACIVSSIRELARIAELYGFGVLVQPAVDEARNAVRDYLKTERIA